MVRKSFSPRLRQTPTPNPNPTHISLSLALTLSLSLTPYWPLPQVDRGLLLGRRRDPPERRGLPDMGRAHRTVRSTVPRAGGVGQRNVGRDSIRKIPSRPEPTPS